MSSGWQVATAIALQIEMKDQFLDGCTDLATTVA
jgi:hypothetical protein